MEYRDYWAQYAEQLRYDREWIGLLESQYTPKQNFLITLQHEQEVGQAFANVVERYVHAFGGSL